MALYQKDRELYRIDEQGGHQVINETVKRRLINVRPRRRFLLLHL